jgi:signal transduction histidine kinase
MRFVPRLSVGQRLTLTMVLVVVLSATIGALLLWQAFRLNLMPRPGPPRDQKQAQSGPGPGPEEMAQGGGPFPMGASSQGGRAGARGATGTPQMQAQTNAAPSVAGARGSTSAPQGRSAAGGPATRSGQGVPSAGGGQFGGPPFQGGGPGQPGGPLEFGPGGQDQPGGRGRRGRGPHRTPLQDPMLIANVLVGVILSLAAGLWLSRRFTRPLTLLAEGAAALRTGHFNHRVPLTGDDEFGRVATSMNQLAERIGDQIEALQADSRRRRQLLADVSHELRSPVATLKTMAEALRDGVAVSPERQERATQAILHSAARMERLVNDLIELARLDLEELPLHQAEIELRSEVTDCLRRHASAAEEAGLVLRPLAPGEPVTALADAHRLAQILDNLVDNAISHAGRGAEVEITIAPGDPLAITVADTGRGIAAEHLPYLFDPFYRGDAARTPGGRHSGLGLRIARGLAQAHGGDLRLESTEGKGTRAVLTLPSNSGTATEMPKAV